VQTDDKARLEEQCNYLLAEMRTHQARCSIAPRRTAAKVSAEDEREYGRLERELKEITGELKSQHDPELEEIRSGGGKGRLEVSQATMSRAFAREPLYEAFRSAGLARGKRAELPWEEFRSLTWTGSVDNLDQPRRAADALGYDQRYAYQALPSVGRRLGRYLGLDPDPDRTNAGHAGERDPGDRHGHGQAGDGGDADRAGDGPQAAGLGRLGHSERLPRERQAGSIVENDLKLAITDALDDLLKQAVAASGFQAPGTDPLLVSVRKGDEHDHELGLVAERADPDASIGAPRFELGTSSPPD
jgi:hypothetical protein